MSHSFYCLFNAKATQYFCKNIFVHKVNTNLVVENITSPTLRKSSQLCSRRSVHKSHDTTYKSKCSFNTRNASQDVSSSFSRSKRLTEQVVLYTNEDTKFLRLINLFGYSCAAFWCYTSYQFATMRITPATEQPKENPNLPWYASFNVMGSQTTKIVMSLGSALIGAALLGGAWIFSARSVGKLILGKGGQTVTFITYNPTTFSMNKAITVDLNQISCKAHRSTNDVVPIKVKGRWMHYLLSKEGTYLNGPLFDKSVGLRRAL
ncbi:hypothetical protein ONE63_006462 [Megalurothrips usitatus]|uniref:Transmembrane protein 223 n=1 Tax=Megalurothrips usitatus TaxID=439358 RepID=A0AAV7XXL9_9NEOP|nr:hypothetical protein ONE63_006462 [Megalurothrips usitatus]